MSISSATEEADITGERPPRIGSKKVIYYDRASRCTKTSCSHLTVQLSVTVNYTVSVKPGQIKQ